MLFQKVARKISGLFGKIDRTSKITEREIAPHKVMTLKTVKEECTSDISLGGSWNCCSHEDAVRKLDPKLEDHSLSLTDLNVCSW
jgi:dihydroxyacid dehydratase/phosphogluconate dehydratase